MQQNPLDFEAALLVCETTLAAGKRSEADAAAAEFRKMALARYGSEGAPLAGALDFQLNDMAGDFAALEKMARADVSNGGQTRLFMALIEEGRVEEATKLMPLSDRSGKEPYELLAVSLALHLAGNSAEAAKWQERAVTLFRTGGRTDTIIDLLGRARGAVA